MPAVMKYKWVEVRPGTYRLVDKSDPRPAVKMPSKFKDAIGKQARKMPFNPSWKKHEEGMWSGNKETSMKQTDKFLDEREHAMKTDHQAKRWEEGRKQEWAKNKKYWARDMVHKGILE